MYVAISRVVRHQHRTFTAHALRTVGIPDVTTKPFFFRAPVNILIRLPDVFAATGKAESFEAHRFESDVARKDQQIGPRNLSPVLLLDRPEQAASLVEADVVGPTVKRGKTLLAPAAAAAAVTDAVGSRRMPGHPNEQRPIVAK